MKYTVALRTLFIKGFDSVPQENIIRHTEFYSYAKAKKLEESYRKEQPMEVLNFEDGSSQIISWKIVSEKKFESLKEGA